MIVSDGGRTGSSQIRCDGTDESFGFRLVVVVQVVQLEPCAVELLVPQFQYLVRSILRRAVDPLAHLGYFVFEFFASSHIRSRSIGRKAITFHPVVPTSRTGGSAVSTLRTNPVLICRRGGRNLLRIAQKPETAERGIARAAVAERSATRKGKNHLSEQAVRDRSGNGRRRTYCPKKKNISD